MSQMPPLDWDLAATSGAAVSQPGPRLTAAERSSIARELHDVAGEAHGLAVEVSGLPDPGDRAPVEVMGRARWIAANAASARRMMAGATDDRPRSEWSLAEKVAARAAGAQAGVVLGWVSGKIIGQLDPFAPEPTLYLVAPNVVQVERELGLVPRDFRLWVAVHELTHRLQMARAPWLRAHLQEQLARVLDAGDDDEPPMVRGARAALVDLVATPAQRRVIDELGAVMSVLEGHAEVMMDAVGPEVIPTIGDIRPAFAARRAKGGWDKVLRKAFGMELKMAQYRDGAAFCRAVLDARGRDVLNRVWEAPSTFPTPEELHQPMAWVERVGDGAA